MVDRGYAHGPHADPLHSSVHHSICATSHRVPLFAPGPGPANHAFQPDTDWALTHPDVLSHAARWRADLPNGNRSHAVRQDYRDGSAWPQ